MKLLTKNILDKLLANGRKQDEVRGTAEEIDFQLYSSWITMLRQTTRALRPRIR